MSGVVGWSQAFDEPVPVPGGKQLVTLRDAALFVTTLPKAEHDAPEWQAAMEALLLVAEHNGPTMFARIGMMRALHRHRPKDTPAPRRKAANAYRLIG
ncbi:hypothetical protein ABIE89_006940 [Bradyrhizobium niftali]|uniref:hypothetical protein n=1 Tax=Bradyrhizobium niftali TaxID=2560055 RepID=UPI003832C97D